MTNDEYLRHLVARVNASAFFVGPPSCPALPSSARVRKHKAMKQLEKLDALHINLLIELLEGKAVMQVIRGEAYSVRKDGDHWVAVNLGDKPVAHAVMADGSACSCPDSKFRGNECKHIEAVRRLL